MEANEVNNLISCYQRHFLVERAIYRFRFIKRFIEFYRNCLEGSRNDFVDRDTVFYILLVNNHVDLLLLYLYTSYLTEF